MLNGTFGKIEIKEIIMAKLTRAIKRNANANAAAKEGFKRADFFAWRRSYIEQLNRTINSPKTSKEEKEQAIKDLKTLKL